MNFLPAKKFAERKFKIDLTLTPAQQEINKSTARFIHVRAGRKFGKTTFTLKKILDWLGPPDSKVWFIAPTYRQGRLISWSTIKRMIPSEAFAKKPNDADMMIQLKNGSELFYMGSDDPDSLRGPDPTGVIFDEAAYHKPEAWYNVVEPNLSVHKAPALFVSTPRGFNWFKDLEDKAKDHPEDWATFHYTIYDNPHIDSKEIERIKNSTDPMVWRQEYMAEYESSVGRVFNFFQDNERHVRPIHIPSTSFDVYRSVDWGMRDDTGCLWGFMKNTEKGMSLYIYREHAENGISPASQARIILAKSPANEKVVMTALSHDAVKQDLEMKGLTVFWHMSNAGLRPLRVSSKDKQASRGKIQELLQLDRLVIDPNCRMLRKQLLSYEWKDTAMEKTEDGKVDLVDALHYLVELLQYRLFADRTLEHEKTYSDKLKDFQVEKEALKIRKYALVQEEETGLDFSGSQAGYL